MSGPKVDNNQQPRGIGASHNLTRAADLALQGKPYVLQKGETKGIWGIAQQLSSITGRSVNDLKNQLLKDNGFTEESAKKLKPGTEIKLPDLQPPQKVEKAEETPATAAPDAAPPPGADAKSSNFTEAADQQRQSLLLGGTTAPGPEIPTNGMPSFRVSTAANTIGTKPNPPAAEALPEPVKTADATASTAPENEPPAKNDAGAAKEVQPVVSSGNMPKWAEVKRAIVTRALDKVYNQPGDEKMRAMILEATVFDARAPKLSLQEIEASADGKSGPSSPELEALIERRMEFSNAADPTRLKQLQAAILADVASLRPNESGAEQRRLQFLGLESSGATAAFAAEIGNDLAEKMGEQAKTADRYARARNGQARIDELRDKGEKLIQQDEASSSAR